MTFWSAKVMCSSKMKPRLREEWAVCSEELCISYSCFLSLMSRDSVSEELSVEKFAVVQEKVC